MIVFLYSVDKLETVRDHIQTLTYNCSIGIFVSSTSY